MSKDLRQLQAELDGVNQELKQYHPWNYRKVVVPVFVLLLMVGGALFLMQSGYVGFAVADITDGDDVLGVDAGVAGADSQLMQDMQTEEVVASEVLIQLNSVENGSDNVTQNSTNVTENLTQNPIQNLTNVTVNITSNVSLNLTQNLTNVTLVNVTVNDTNVTYSAVGYHEENLQGEAEIEKPVQWKKRIYLNQSGNVSVTVELPVQAMNIEVVELEPEGPQYDDDEKKLLKKNFWRNWDHWKESKHWKKLAKDQMLIEDEYAWKLKKWNENWGEEKWEDKNHVLSDEPLSSHQPAITGFSVADTSSDGLITRLLTWFMDMFGVTGMAVGDEAIQLISPLPSGHYNQTVTIVYNTSEWHDSCELYIDEMLETLSLNVSVGRNEFDPMVVDAGNHTLQILCVVNGSEVYGPLGLFEVSGDGVTVDPGFDPNADEFDTMPESGSQVDFEEGEVIELNITGEVGEPPKVYEISYETPGPTKTELEEEGVKTVVIESSLHMENILARTYVPNVAAGSIVLRWVTVEERVRFEYDPILNVTYETWENVTVRKVVENLTYIDEDMDGLVEGIEWRVPHLSNQTYELTIEVLNVYSYLKDGDEWTVYFNTTGTGNLTVTAIAGELDGEWTEEKVDNFLTDNEMTFLEAKCGNDSVVGEMSLLVNDSGDMVRMNYSSMANGSSQEYTSLFWEEYNCDGKTGSVKNLVHHAGYIGQEFDFGGQKAYAWDPAGGTCTTPVGCQCGTDCNSCRGDEPAGYNTFDECEDGTNCDDSFYVNNVHIDNLDSSDRFEGGDTVNATCEFKCQDGKAEYAITYYNGADWYNITGVQTCPADGILNISETFDLNNTWGSDHVVRCQMSAEMDPGDEVCDPTDDNLDADDLNMSLSCIEPYDGLDVVMDTTLCSGTYNLADTGNDGIITFTGSDHILTCEGTIIKDSGVNGRGISETVSSRITIDGCHISGYQYNIYVNGFLASGWTIKNSVIETVQTTGIFFTGSTRGHTLLNNIFNGTTGFQNIYLSPSSDNVIDGNTFDTDEDAIKMNGADNNLIIRNKFVYVEDGIEMLGNSNGNNITQNKWDYTRLYSIKFAASDTGNTVWLNAFIDAYVSGKVSDSAAEGQNQYNLSGMGNYWEEHNDCNDDDGDYICDFADGPYDIDNVATGGDSDDYYPFKGPWNMDCLIPYDDYSWNDNVSVCQGTFNIDDANPDGLFITAGSDITLDCNDSRFVGDGVAGTYAVFADGNYDDNKVVNCNFTDYTTGINLEGVSPDNWNISDNYIDSSTNAVYIDNGDGAEIKGNTLDGTGNGIYVEGHVDDVNAFNNEIDCGAGSYGIYLRGSTSDYTDNWDIFNNSIHDCLYGVYGNSYYTGIDIHENIIRDNIAYGIQFQSTGTNGATVYKNTFFGNSGGETQVKNNVEAGMSFDSGGYGNHWYLYDSPAEGCYDTNSNGICDDAYSDGIDGPGEDNYPLAYASGCVVPVDDTTFERSTLLCSGTYEVVDEGGDGILQITGDDMSLVFDDTVITGSLGTGLKITGSAGFNVYGTGRISGFDQGVFVDPSNNGTVCDLQVNGSTYGLLVDDVENSTFCNITAWNNTYGIYVNRSNNNTFNDSHIFNNTYGLYTKSTSTENVIHGNNFSDNQQYQAYAEASGNTFYTVVGGKNHGNWWKDIVDNSLNLYDADSDGYADAGGAYPYSFAKGGNVSAYVIDYGPQPAPDDCVEPVDDMEITTDVSLCSGTYQINDAGATGVVILAEDNVTVTCQGTVLIGNNTGTGILMPNLNGEVRGCTAKNYSKGIWYKWWPWDHYPSSGNDYDDLYDVVVDSEDDIIAVGRAKGVPPGAQFRQAVSKLTTDGEKLWDHNFSVYGGVFDAVDVDSEDDIWAVGYRALIPSGPAVISVSKFDKNGTSVWNWTGAQGLLKGVAVDSNDDVIMSGDSGGLFVRKVDNAGAEIWNWTGTISLVAGQLYAVDTDSSDNVIAVGYEYNVGSDGIFEIVKLNSGGVWQWNWTHNESEDTEALYDVVIDESDDSIIVVGIDETQGIGNEQYHVIKLNSAGVVQWNWTYDDTDDTDMLEGVALDSNGDIIAAGYDGSSVDNARVFKISSAGVELADWTSPRAKFDQFYGAAVDSEDSVILAGSSTTDYRTDRTVTKLTNDLTVPLRNVTIFNSTLVNNTYGIYGSGYDGNGTVYNNTIYNNSYGIYSAPMGGGMSFYNNNITDCGDGVFTKDLASSNFSFNTFASNDEGLKLTDSSDDNVVHNNSFLSNDYGVYIDSSIGNLVYFNNFSNSANYQAYADVAGNYLYISDGGVDKGNWWSDILTNSLDIFDGNGDDYGDTGTAYPYSLALGGNVSSNLEDRGPRPVAGSCYDNDADGWYSTASASGCADYFDCNDTNASLYPPSANLTIKNDTWLCNGTYYINDSSGLGVVRFGSSNISLTCMGTVIVGNNSGIGQLMSQRLIDTQGCVWANYSRAGWMGNIWNWTNNPSTGSDVLRDVAVDSRDNIIAAGYDYVGGDNRFYVVKMYPNQTKIWEWTFDPSSGDDELYSIAVDSEDNVLVAGVDATNVNNELYVAKLSSAGVFIWNWTSNPSILDDQLRGVTVDDEDNVIAVGYYYIAPGNIDWYVVKLNSSGNKTWNWTGGYSGHNDYLYGVAADSEGNITAVGINNTDDRFIMKLDASGSMLWNASYTKHATGGYLKDVIIGDSDTIYAAGRNSNANKEFHVMEFTPDGNNTWNWSEDALGGEGSLGVALDSIGNVFTVGSYAANFYYAKISPTGTKIKSGTIDFGGTELFYSVATDSSDNVIFVGSEQLPGNSEMFMGRLTNDLVDVGHNVTVFNMSFENSTYGLYVNGYFENATIYNNSFLNNDYGLMAEENVTGMKIYYNNFSNSNVLQAYVESAGSVFNTTVGGVAQGNWWSDILTAPLWIWDSDDDTWGDIGEEYPYRKIDGASVSFQVVDYGPQPAKSCYDDDGDGFYNTSSHAACPWARDCDDGNASLFPPRDDLLIQNDSWLCNGTYYVNDSLGIGVVKFASDNITLECLGTVVVGNNSGTGVFMSDSLVGLEDCTFANYTNALWSGGLWNHTLNISQNASMAMDTVVDSEDNIIIAGSLFNLTDWQFYVEKMYPNGTTMWYWVKNLTDSTEIFEGLAVDDEDNIYVTGNDARPNGPDEIAHVYAFDKDGGELWDVEYNFSDDSDSPKEIVVDYDGNIVVVGFYEEIGANWAFFVVKMDDQGNSLWNWTYDRSDDTDVLYAVAIDSNNNIFVAGTSRDFLAPEFYIAKFTADGLLLNEWSLNLSNRVETFQDLIVDSEDNLIAVGYGRWTGDYQMHVRKFDNSLNDIWNFTGIYADESRAQAVDLDSEGNIYVGGGVEDADSNTSWFVVKLDPDGNHISNSTGGVNTTMSGLQIDSNDNIILGGITYLMLPGYVYTHQVLRLSNDMSEDLHNIIVYNNTFENSTYGMLVSATAENGSIYNNSFRNNSYGVYLDDDVNEMKFYYNNFSGNSVYQAYAVASGNHFNTSNGSACGAQCARGNWWSDILSSGLSILDVNQDTWGDSGDDYPYNSTNGGLVNLYVQDEGPQPALDCVDADGDGTYSLTSDPECARYFDCNDTNASILPPYRGLLVDRNITLCSGYYEINATGGTDRIINFTADNVWLTGNDTHVVGNWVGTFVMAEDRINIQILNLTIENYSISVHLMSDDSLVQNIVINGSAIGMYVEDNADSRIDNVEIKDANYGIYTKEGAIRNNITNILVQNPILAGVLMISRGNFTFENITILNSSTMGFYAGTSSWYTNNNTEFINITVDGYGQTVLCFGGYKLNDSIIRNSTFRNCSVGLTLNESYGNLVYHNNFTGNSLLHATTNVSGNQFNTTVDGVPQGNYWSDVSSENLKIYDSDSDNWGDYGAEYPYKAVNRANVSSLVIDWGPWTSETNAVPIVTDVVLVSIADGNYSNENLSVTYSSADSDGEDVKNITTWYVDGDSIALMQMPFEATEGNESEWFKDYSNNSNHGTVNGATWNSTGGFDGWGAYEFDGVSSYLTVPPVNMLPDWSYETRFKLNQEYNSGSTASQHLYGVGGPNPDTYLILTANTGKIRFRTYAPTNDLNTTTAVWEQDRWYHVVIVCEDNALKKIYVDGVLENSVAAECLHISETGSPQIGKYLGGGGHVNGTIDEVSLYARALTDKQVLALYNNLTDEIHHLEEYHGEVWQACIVGNDRNHDGEENCSNTLRTLEVVGRDVVLNSTYEGNTTDENLTLFWGLRSVINDTVKNVTQYYVNGSGYPLLNMPFEAVPNRHVAIEDDLVGGWWFEGDASDASAGGNDGTLHNGVLNVSGKVGSAYVFDGDDDYISLPNVNPTDEITVSAWVKTNGSAYYSGWNQIVSKYSAYLLGCQPANSDTMRFAIYNGTAWQYSGTYAVPNPEEWHHFLGTYDSAEGLVKLYVDGKLVTQDSGTGTINADSGGIHIGHRELPGAYYFAGTIDEVAIWNRSFSYAEAKAVFTDGLSVHQDVKDYSNQSNHVLTGVHNVTWNRTGGYDGFGAYEFDGDEDYVDIAYDPSFDFGLTDSFTLMAWIKTASSANGFIVNKRNTGSNPERYSMWIRSTGELYGIISQDATSSSTTIDGTQVNDGGWHHVTMVYDRSTQNITRYVDGQQTGTIDAIDSSIDPSTDAKLVIGARNYDVTSYDNFFNGTIDELKVFNKSLSPEQVLALYENRTDFIVLNETVVGDVWLGCVVTNDMNEDGTENCSNTVTILEGCVDEDGDGFNADGFGVDELCGEIRDCDDSNASILPPYDDMLVTNDTWLCPGTYYINETGSSGIVRIDNNDTAVTCMGTVIVGNNSQEVFWGEQDYLDNVTIQNCMVANYSQGLYASRVNDWTIYNNTFVNITGSGMGSRAIVLNYDVTNVNIIGNTFIDSGSNDGNSIYAMIIGAAWGVTENNTIEDNLIDNLYCTGYSSCQVFGIYIQSGIGQENGTGNLIKDNVIRNLNSEGSSSLGIGLAAFRGHEGVVVGNNISNISSIATEAGIWDFTTKYYNYSGNRVNNISNCFVNNFADFYIGINSTIENNDFWNCSKALFIEDGEDIWITQNNITDSVVGIELQNSSRVLVYNNTIYGNDYGANLSGEFSDNVFYWNNFSSNNLYHVYSSEQVADFNTTAVGVAQGNWWSDIVTNNLEILTTNGDIWGDDGGNWPYNSTNGANVSDYVNDYGPRPATECYDNDGDTFFNTSSVASCPRERDCVDNNASIFPPHNDMNITVDSWLCPGSYNINTSTSARGGLIYTANAGVTLTCNQTVIYGNGTGELVGSAGGLGSNVHIKDCEFYDYQYGFRSVGANNLHDNLTMYDFTSYSYYIQGDQNFTLMNSRLWSGGTGFYVRSLNGGWFVNNTVNGTGTSYGLRFYNSDSVIVEDNNLISSGVGIEVTSWSGGSCDDWMIKNNFVANSTLGIIIKNPTTNFTVFNNTIYDTTDAVYLDDGTGGSPKANISFNNITQTSDNSIQFDVEADGSIIHNNTFHDALGGVYIGATSNNNTFYYNRFTGSVTTYYAEAVAAGNYFNITNGSNCGALCARGNYWEDILTNSLQIYDVNNDTWGDAGSQYPYNSTNGGSVSVNVNDWGPQPALNATPPVVTDVVLNSSFGTNLTTENLTVYYNSTNIFGTQNKNITNWFLDGVSTTVLNIPFEITGGDNESTWTGDYSNNSNHGTVSAAVFNATGGHDGFGAYEFDGASSEIALPDLSGDFGTEASLVMWVKLDDDSPDTVEQTGFMRLGTSSSIDHYPYHTDGIIYTGVFRNTRLSFNDGAFDKSKWHMVTVTQQPGTNGWKFYQNLTLVYQTTGLAQVFMPSAPFIGDSTGDRWLDGYIDDVMIFNHSLTYAEIELLYNHKNDMILSNVTAIGDVWQACITPTDGTYIGETNCSNTLEIVAPPPPVVTDVVLNSSLGTNLTSENLTVYFNSSDYEDGPVKNITNWFVDGDSWTIVHWAQEGSVGNESEWVRDYSENNSNHGTVAGTTWSSSSGYDGWGAHEFLGTDASYIQQSAVTNWPTTAISVEFWIKSSDGGEGLVSYSASGHSNEEFLLFNSDNLQVYVGGAATAGTGIVISDGSWHHVVVTWRSSDGQVKIYKDGTSAYTGTIASGDSMVQGGCLYLTQEQDAYCGGLSSGQAMAGYLDDFKVYDRALSPEQVLMQYNNRTDMIDSNETEPGEVWFAGVTGNDGIQDSATNYSNDLTIFTPPLPTVTDVVLNSTYGTNYSNENLTVYYNSSNADSLANKNITNWYVDNVSIMLLNMPFEVTGGDNESAWTRDFTNFSMHADSVTADWQPTGGYDGWGAYDFTGADLIQIDDSTHFDMADFTYSVWIDADTTVGYDTIIDVDNDEQMLALNGGVYSIYGRCGAQGHGSYTSGWRHLVWTVEGSNYKLYVNGSEVGSGSGCSASVSVDNALMIGSGYGGNEYFDGRIDDVRIFNHSLSAEQVLLLYQNETDKIHHAETAADEVWRACVTPVYDDRVGLENCSNELTILESLVPPVVSNVVLDSTSGQHYDGDNLSVTYDVNDFNGDNTTNITSWYVNGTSIMALNMPFEATGGNESIWTKDYTNNSNHGTVTTATWNSEGGYDGWGAYDFDGGTNFIGFTDDATLEPAEFTLEAWVNVDTYGDYEGIIHHMEWSGLNCKGYHLTTQSGPNRFFFRVDDGSGCSAISAAAGSGWQHVVGTFNGTNMSLYLDGVYQDSTTSSVSYNDSRTLFIGKYSDSNEDIYFDGDIDQVRIWNRSLLAEQILALYENRTDFVDDDETEVGDVWRACVAANDGNEYGLENCSNDVAIQEASPSCVDPYDDMYINVDTTLCAGTFHLNDASADGLIIINASDVTLTCEGTVMNGSATGTGLTTAGAVRSGVNIDGCTWVEYDYGYIRESGSGFQDSNISNCSFGDIDINSVYLQTYESGLKFEDCSFYDLVTTGTYNALVYLLNTDYHTFKNNYFRELENSRYALFIRDLCNYNNITGNIFNMSSTDRHAIDWYGGDNDPDTSDNNFWKNVFYGRGIELSDSWNARSYNIVTTNSFCYDDGSGAVGNAYFNLSNANGLERPLQDCGPFPNIETVEIDHGFNGAWSMGGSQSGVDVNLTTIKDGVANVPWGGLVNVTSAGPFDEEVDGWYRDNVTVDCNNIGELDNSANTGTGMELRYTQNFTVQNCTFDRFQYSMRFFDLRDSSFYNNSISGFWEYGVLGDENSDRILWDGNTFSDGSQVGRTYMYINDPDYWQIQNNDFFAVDNAYALYLRDIDGLNVTNNTFNWSGNGYWAVDFYGTTYVINGNFWRNTFYGRGFDVADSWAGRTDGNMVNNDFCFDDGTGAIGNAYFDGSGYERPLYDCGPFPNMDNITIRVDDSYNNGWVWNGTTNGDDVNISNIRDAVANVPLSGLVNVTTAGPFTEEVEGWYRDNVTVDCNNIGELNNGADTNYGMELRYSQNFTVQNCTFDRFQYSLRLFDLRDSYFYNNSISGFYDYGVAGDEGADRILWDGNTFSDGSRVGRTYMYMNDPDYWQIQNNDFSAAGNAYAFYLRDIDGLNVTNNTFNWSGNGYWAIDIYGATYVINANFWRNTFYGRGFDIADSGSGRTEGNMVNNDFCIDDGSGVIGNAYFDGSGYERPWRDCGPFPNMDSLTIDVNDSYNNGWVWNGTTNGDDVNISNIRDALANVPYHGTVNVTTAGKYDEESYLWYLDNITLECNSIAEIDNGLTSADGLDIRYLYNFSVSNCIFDQYLVQVRMIDVEDSKVYNNSFTAASDDGVYLDVNSHGNNISGNYFGDLTGTSNYQLRIYGGDYNTTHIFQQSYFHSTHSHALFHYQNHSTQLHNQMDQHNSC
ncbi:LamG-like jellyroll fold domain-containing protein [Nanoarchaeota archaeon]